MCKYFHGQALCGGPLKTLKMCKYFHLQAVCGGSLYIYTLALNLSSRAGKGWLVRYLICFCHTCQPCSCCGRYRQLGTKMAAVMLLVFVTFKHRFLTNRTKHWVKNWFYFLFHFSVEGLWGFSTLGPMRKNNNFFSDVMPATAVFRFIPHILKWSTVNLLLSCSFLQMEESTFKAASFSKSASVRQMSLQERKQAMLEAARKRYKEKHGIPWQHQVLDISLPVCLLCAVAKQYFFLIDPGKRNRLLGWWRNERKSISWLPRGKKRSQADFLVE